MSEFRVTRITEVFTGNVSKEQPNLRFFSTTKVHNWCAYHLPGYMYVIVDVDSQS